MTATRKVKPSPNGSVLESMTGMIEIAPLRLVTAEFRLTGVASYCQLRFSQKTMKKIADTQQKGEQAKSSKRRVPRDFDDDYEQAMHYSTEGWIGIPTMAFKNAMVSACRLAGVPMTRAKILVNVLGDGVDRDSSESLVRITGDPQPYLAHVRNATGVVDLRMRALWKEWSVERLKVQFDASCIGSDAVLHLLHRAGRQIGVGEGRPDSKKSCGLGFGLFDTDLA